jgi:hypothetical protein
MQGVVFEYIIFYLVLQCQGAVQTPLRCITRQPAPDSFYFYLFFTMYPTAKRDQDLPCRNIEVHVSTPFWRLDLR